jgi:hypothetical protein
MIYPLLFQKKEKKNKKEKGDMARGLFSLRTYTPYWLCRDFPCC